MPDPVKMSLEPIPPIAVTVISGTGDGGVPATGTIITTPDHQPNYVVTVVSPFVAILIRFLNVYIGSLAGILAGAMASNVIPASDFTHLFMKCASLALGGSVLLSLKDIGTVLTGLEKTHPLATGSV